MSATKFLNRVTITVGDTGTASFTVGAAASTDKFTPAEAGGVDGDIVGYVYDQNGDVEMGYGVLGSSATTLTRTVVKSKIGGVVGTTKIDVDGTGVLSLDVLADDLASSQLILTEEFTGNGGATYTLSSQPISLDACIVTIDGGPIVPKSAMSLSGKTITFGENILNGRPWQITYLVASNLSPIADIVRGTFAQVSGVGTVKTLAGTPPTNNSLFVFYGTELQPNDGSVYTWLGNQLTTVVDPEGDDVSYFFTQALAIGQPAAASVGSIQLKPEVTGKMIAMALVFGG